MGIGARSRRCGWLHLRLACAARLNLARRRRSSFAKGAVPRVDPRHLRRFVRGAASGHIVRARTASASLAAASNRHPAALLPVSRARLRG